MSLATVLSGEVVIVTGPPGAGKSTVASALVERMDRGVVVEGDSFFHSIRRGWLPPWKPESHAQNTVVIRAIGAAAASFAAGDYAVIVEGIVGPWFLDEFRVAAPAPTHYVVLRPSEDAAMSRVTVRGAPRLSDPTVVSKMYEEFSGLGDLEAHVVDSTDQDVDETATLVAERLEAGTLRLG